MDARRGGRRLVNRALRGKHAGSALERKIPPPLALSRSEPPGVWSVQDAPLHDSTTSCNHEAMRYAGVFVKASEIHLAVVDRDTGSEGYGSAVPDAYSRENYPGSPSDPSKLLEFIQRIRQDLRDWSIRGVVVIDTTKYSNWVYMHAQQRVLCIAAVMVATAEESIPFEICKPGIVGTHISSPKLEKLEPNVFELQGNPKYWTTGAREAYAAAAFAAREQ